MYEGRNGLRDFHTFSRTFNINFKNKSGVFKGVMSKKVQDLLSCAGAFRARKVQLWQIDLSKSGVEGGYKSVR